MDDDEKEVYDAFQNLIDQLELDTNDVMHYLTYMLAETLAGITNGNYSKQHILTCASVLETTYNLMCGVTIDAAAIH